MSHVGGWVSGWWRMLWPVALVGGGPCRLSAAGRTADISSSPVLSCSHRDVVSPPRVLDMERVPLCPPSAALDLPSPVVADR